jgi:hypothetical protein
MPGASFKKWAIQARNHITELIRAPVLIVQQEMVSADDLSDR